jgi:superfamily II RNA helicase
MKRPDRFHEGRSREQTGRREREPPIDRSHAPRRETGPQNRELRELLAGIGAPKPSPFTPDPFQLEALAALESKTSWSPRRRERQNRIAREEIRRLLEAGKRAWYTTPLKALTNSKYAEFSEEFGGPNVGILTGDRRRIPTRL